MTGSRKGRSPHEVSSLHQTQIHAQDPLLCARDAILRDRLADFLRDQHSSNTAKEVGRKAKLPPRTVERWLAGLSSPRLEHFIRLLHAYGPALLKAAMDDNSIRAMKRNGGFDWVDRLRVAEDQEKSRSRSRSGAASAHRFALCATIRAAGGLTHATRRTKTRNQPDFAKNQKDRSFVNRECTWCVF